MPEPVDLQLTPDELEALLLFIEQTPPPAYWTAENAENLQVAYRQILIAHVRSTPKGNR